MIANQHQKNTVNSSNTSHADIYHKNSLGNGNRTPCGSYKNIPIGKRSDVTVRNSKDTILNTSDYN